MTVASTVEKDARPWWRFLRRREVRRMHNDRDYECRYWWGDRGGYLFAAERCPLCNPVISSAVGKGAGE